jgi:cytochrome c oxidase subunit 1
MLVFSHSLHALGLMGMPRRTMISAAPYALPEWRFDLLLTGIGGCALFLSALLYFLNIVLTMTASRQPAPAMPAFAEAISGPEEAPAFLDRWPIWLTVSAALILVAYGPTIYHLLMTTPFDSPGFRVW